MSKSKVLVYADYFENYSNDASTPHWKPKGEHIFYIEIDIDIMSCYESADGILRRLVERHNNSHCKFEYIDYAIEWHTPTLLATEEDYVALGDEYYVVS